MTEDAPDRRLHRRDLLRLGAVGAAAAVAGCAGRDGGDEPPSDDDETPTFPERDPSEPIPYADRYGSVVDVVEDAGADPTGTTSIRSVLERAAGDDTLLFFPPGEYLLDDIWTVPSFDNLGIVGDDATIVPKEGYFGYLFVLGLESHDARNLLFEGIDFDFTAADTAPRPIQAQVDDGLLVRNVAVKGLGGTARFDVTTAEGSGVVRNLELPDGGREPNPVGVLVGPANEGRLSFQYCHVEGFQGNGLYASPSNGPVEVLGGLYANNGIASVRVSSPATVRDATVRCDRAPDGFRNMRGIRLRHGDSILVENCTVEMTDLTYSDGAIVVEPMMNAATIRDVDVDVSVDDVPALNARSPRNGSGPFPVNCERVRVTGDAGQGEAMRLVDRAESRLEGLDVQQSGANRDGLFLLRSGQSVLRNSQIDVTGDPIVLRESQLQRMDNQL